MIRYDFSKLGVCFAFTGLAAVCFALAGLLVGGCNSNTISEVEDLQTVAVFSRGDQLQRTMEYVQSVEPYDLNEFRDNVNSGLNRWITSSVGDFADIAWTATPLVDTLPPAMGESDTGQRIDDKGFSANDAFFIRQANWLKAVANRVTGTARVASFQPMFQTALAPLDSSQREALRDVDDLVVEMVRLLHPDLSDASDDPAALPPAIQLASALKLFDWTVRNVALLTEPSWPVGQELVDRAITSGFTQLSPDVQAKAWPPQAGAYGPGYQRFPWQAMATGRGDYLDRAEIFALLCREVNLDAVILALPETEPSTRPYREWLPAVLIDGRFYLFDTQLGLPIPGSKAGSIATLDEVVSNPELLSRLDLTVEESIDKLDYPVRAPQLENLTALLVAAPAAISKRMTLLEASLTGNARLKLTVDVDAMAQRVRKAAAFGEVQLWHVPFSTTDFRHEIDLALRFRGFDSELVPKIRWVVMQEVYSEAFLPFGAARQMYFHGKFESDRNDSSHNALSHYHRFMTSDDEVSQLEQDSILQAQLGIFRKVNQSVSEWREELAVIKARAALVRSDAAFFLAMCHYENGHPKTSLRWLDRIGMYDDDARWSEFIEYQRGRANEALGKFDDAAEAYELEKSAQRHGNLIRKRQLKELTETGTSS